MRQSGETGSSFPISSVCDGKTAVMEMLSVGKARLEKEKAAEKAEVKGGIHGRLEKAKAEIKAKEADKSAEE